MDRHKKCSDLVISEGKKKERKKERKKETEKKKGRKKERKKGIQTILFE